MNTPLQLTLPGEGKELAINGHCRYQLNGEHIGLSVEEVTNNRIEHTLSGDLTMELWALPAPYQGGGFSGFPMAHCPLGSLQGQHCLRNWQHKQWVDVPAQGLWYLSLMLREWDNGRYITRDYINFPNPVKADYKLMLSVA